MRNNLISMTAVALCAVAATPGSVGAQTWTQVYGGLGVGVNAFTGQADLIDKSTGSSVLSGGGPFGADIGATAMLGADYQVGSRFLIGGFAAYDWSGAAIKMRFNEASAGVTANASVVSIQDMWTVGGRAGMLLGRDTLLYGLVGYSWIRVDDLTASLTSGGTTNSVRLPLPSSQGVTLGAGVEHKLSNNVSLRAEYRTTDYGRETIFENGNLAVTGSARSHLARIGAFYRLGGNGGEEARVARDGWSGFHFGAGLGLVAYQRELDIKGTSPGHVGDEFVMSGLGGGNSVIHVAGGYDFRLAPRVIAGVVVSADLAAGSHALTLAGGGESLRLDLLNQKYSLSIGGRLGYLFSPTLLGFVTGGYALAQFDDATLQVSGTDVFRFPFPRLSGGFVGIGFEKQLSENISLTSQYVYTKYQGHKVDGFAILGGDEARVSFDPSSHAVKATLNYRIGDGK